MNPQRNRRSLYRLALATVAAIAVAASGLTAQIALADHGDVPSGDGEQFVWPVDSWLSANHKYPDGDDHSGSADLSTAHYALIKPARAGEVIVSQYRNGSYGVRIKHERDDGGIYITQYDHLAEKPKVKVGQQVGLDDELGYVGRTGMAFWAGPHIHFTIREAEDDSDKFGGTPLEIPDLPIGTWAESGDFIPGDFEGLSPIDSRPDRTFDVEVTTKLGAYETTARRHDEKVGEVSAGDELTVLRSHQGQYRVSIDGEPGWIPQSGTQPVESPVFGVKVTASDTVNIRSSPEESDENLIGVVPADLDPFMPGFDTGGANDDWMLVMWRCNAETNRGTGDDHDGEPSHGGCESREEGDGSFWKYGWVGPANAEPSEEFHSRVWQENLNVAGNQVVDGQNQPDSSVKIGELGEFRDLVHVREIVDGWYRLDYNGEIGWVRGWYTGGIH